MGPFSQAITRERFRHEQAHSTCRRSAAGRAWLYVRALDLLAKGFDASLFAKGEPTYLFGWDNPNTVAAFYVDAVEVRYLGDKTQLEVVAIDDGREISRARLTGSPRRDIVLLGDYFE
jgi:hypothetical protein